MKINHKSKGFTLVELLAVIVVLAIILAVAIPQILKLVEKSKKDAFNVSESMLVKAARDYAALGELELPKVVDGKVVLNYTTLTGKNKINQIFDPKTNEECSGIVTIIKEVNNKYSYIPNLSCTSYQSVGVLIPPIITRTGAAEIDWPINTTYVDPGATAIDAVDGEVAVTINDDAVIESTMGTYTVTFNVTDTDGNLAIEVTREVTIVDDINPTFVNTPTEKFEPVTTIDVTGNPEDLDSGINYWKYRISSDDGVTYGTWSSNVVGDTNETITLNTIGINKIEFYVEDVTGNIFTKTSNRYMITSTTVWNYGSTGSQTFSVPYEGIYKIEGWGAAGGGDGGAIGAKGGYSTGETTFVESESISVYIGGVGLNGTNVVGGFNGGGRSGVIGSSGSGGGATDFREGGIALSNRVLIAGGGGGAGNADGSTALGHGGGATGINGNTSSTNRGTQSSGGTSGNGNGSLGVGANHTVDGGGGGGGYYGGGAGNGDHSGGGGSGYIGGVSSGQTIAGNTSMPNPAGGTMTGRSGSGYARITFISVSAE